VELCLQHYTTQPVWNYTPKEISVVLRALGKIGVNWDTLQISTRKSLVIGVSKTFRRFSPLMILQSFGALGDMDCSFSILEICAKRIENELNEENRRKEESINGDLNAHVLTDTAVQTDARTDVRTDALIGTNTVIGTGIGIGSERQMIAVTEAQTVTETGTERVDDQLGELGDRISVNEIEITKISDEKKKSLPRKRKIPSFVAFRKTDLFNVIHGFVYDRQFNCWEMVQLLQSLSESGTRSICIVFCGINCVRVVCIRHLFLAIFP
jgi:hypothetical protein